MTMSAAEKQVVEEVAADLATAATWISGNRSRQLAGNAVKLQALLDGQHEQVKGKRAAEALNAATADGDIAE